MEAVPYWRSTEEGIDVFLNAPYAGFVFVERAGSFVARAEVIVRVVDRRRREIVVEESWTDTLRVPSFEETQSFERWIWHGRLAVPPGSYVVEVDVVAMEGGGTATRAQRVDVQSHIRQTAAMSDVRLTVRQDTASFAPFAGAHLPAGYDSLRAVVDLLYPTDGMQVTMQLVRFPSDTSIAVAPFYFSPMGWTLPSVGVAYDRPELVQQSSRSLQDPVERLRIFFSLPPLEEGVYQVSIAAEPVDSEVIRSSREFVVMSPEFPRVSTLDQMIDALTYIARDREMEHLRAAADPDERRARFDAFWGSLIPNREEAATVMKEYYARVEEANVLFSNYKEGWKTDRGMAFVVLGMPLFREIQPRREIWHYSYGRKMQPDYIFDRATIPHLNPMYDHFIMQRSPAYEAPWVRAVERWREGQAL